MIDRMLTQRIAVSPLRSAALAITLLLLSGCAIRQVERSTSDPAVEFKATPWSRVDGWQEDQTQEAWGAFLATCQARGSHPDWQSVCTAATSQSISDPASARLFFETHFTPYRILQKGRRSHRDTGLITGYYEPLLRGARRPTASYTVPLYAPPDDLLTIDLSALYPELKGKTVRGRLRDNTVVPYPSRAELDQHPGVLGKEIVWVEGALDAFYLQIQGTGRVQFENGEVIRVAYADQNGHPYRSIGRYLVEQGELTLEQATAQGIRRWIEAHPQRSRDVLNANPSFVFFREEAIANPSEGPKGALGVPLTPARSVAIDPRLVPLGAPIFLSTTQPASDVPLRRLTMAQDTGGAIRGAVRADLFWGFGVDAAESAGRMRQEGRLWLLWPKDHPLP